MSAAVVEVTALMKTASSTHGVKLSAGCFNAQTRRRAVIDKTFTINKQP
jgi:hypothetical protein